MANLTNTVWLSSQPPPLTLLTLSAHSSLPSKRSSLNIDTHLLTASSVALNYSAVASLDPSSPLAFEEYLLPSLPASGGQLTAAPIAQSASSTLAWSPLAATRPLVNLAGSLRASPGSALSSIDSPSPTPAPSFQGVASTRLAKRWEGEYRSSGDRRRR